MKVLNEKVNKKLSIFYHPFFQDLIEAWSFTYSPLKTNLNMMTFIELNLRIQKAIIPIFHFQNSLNSALTDWHKELDDLAIKSSRKSSQGKVISNNKINLSNIVEVLNNLPFDATVSNDKYLSFFKANKTHISLKYLDTHLSLIGFGKFLFDLCVSWCENLDIELFILFLSGLFLQITSGHSLNNSTLIRTDDIVPLNQLFLNQMKMFKTHYERYKKKDLSSFQIWYEWNYLPSRLQEITKRVIDTLKSNYHTEESSRLNDLAQLFDNIIKKSNFDYLSTAEGFLSQLKFLGQLSFNDNTNESYTDGSIDTLGDNGVGISTMDTSFDTHIDIERTSVKHAKVVKKLCMPIFGKSVAKQQMENNKPHVHTINNHSLFFDNEVNDAYVKTDIGLYPIWEKGELSDYPSGNTLYQGKRGLFNSSMPVSPFAASPILRRNSSHVTANSIKHTEEKEQEIPEIFPKFNKNKIVCNTTEDARAEVKHWRNQGLIFKDDSNDNRTQNFTVDSCINSNTMNKSSLNETIVVQDNYNILVNNENKNIPNFQSTQDTFEGYLEDIKNLSYYQSENNEFRALKPSIKIKPSFLNKNLTIISPSNSKNIKLGKLSLHRDNEKEKEKERKKIEDEKLNHSFKLDLSYQHDTTLLSKPFYNRKKILTANAKSNFITNGLILSSQKNPDLESLTIIAKKTYSTATTNKNDLSMNSVKMTTLESLSGESTTVKPQRSKSNIMPAQKFDFSIYEELFPEGLEQFEIDKVKNDRDYFKKIEEIKKTYNQQFKSEFLKSLENKINYPSSRHEMGGFITELERNEFLKRVERKWETKLQIYENRKNSGAWKSGRRLKILDNPKIIKAFINPDNKTLFKEVMTFSQIK